MIILSVFNWNLDLDLPRYGLIYKVEYIFDFMLLNICLLSGYLNRNKKIGQYAPWILTLLFCLYAFWDEDYFNFAETFYEGLSDFRDLLYSHLQVVSLGSYIIFRLFIWGSALLIYYLTSRRFKISSNISIFVFIFFFLLTFSYARVSLGMAFYFYGLSYILIINNKLQYRILCASIFFILAFCAHRSMVFLIILTPVCFLNMTKRRAILMICFIPIVAYCIKYTVNYVTSGALIGDSSVSEAANQYASYIGEQEMNWKYKLVTNIHYLGFYIALLSIIYKVIYKVFMSNPKNNISPFVLRLIPLISIIQIIAFCLINSSAFGLWIIGYRFLYMTGIPLCLIIGWMYQNHFLNKKWLRYIFFCPILYSEGFILGKILSGS